VGGISLPQTLNIKENSKKILENMFNVDMYLYRSYETWHKVKHKDTYQHVKTSIHSGPMICFITKDFIKQKYFKLLWKANLAPCKIINGHIFPLTNVIHETQLLEVRLNEFIQTLCSTLSSCLQI
jgi:hypothetical protein